MYVQSVPVLKLPCLITAGKTRGQCIWIHAHTYIHTYIPAWLLCTSNKRAGNLHVYTQIHTYIHTWNDTPASSRWRHMDVCMYVCMHFHIHVVVIYIHTHTYSHTYIYIHAYIYICHCRFSKPAMIARVYTCVFYIHAYRHLHMHIHTFIHKKKT